jgi:hypothetical protein
MKKYPNTYTVYNAQKDWNSVRSEVYKIGISLISSSTTLPKWSKNQFNICRTRNATWYFAYKIENNVVYVYDTENHRNMSGNAYVATSNKKTDGNYNPNRQFLDDGKHRSRTFIINERQLGILVDMKIDEINPTLTLEERIRVMQEVIKKATLID